MAEGGHRQEVCEMEGGGGQGAGGQVPEASCSQTSPSGRRELRDLA